MKSIIISTVLALVNLNVFAQKSSVSKDNHLEATNIRLLINDASATRTNKDWSLAAEFKSGINETLTFFPIEVVNLMDNSKSSAIQLDIKVRTAMGGGGLFSMAVNPMNVVTPSYLLAAMNNDGNISAWLGYDEIDGFIEFLEKTIIPNLNVKYKEKSSEFKFQSKEITLKYLIHEKRKRLSVFLNEYPEYIFWTESRAEKIDELLPILKKVKNKELEF